MANTRTVDSSEKVKTLVASATAWGKIDGLRRSGLEIVGAVPWGTHFCQFYETVEDLVDVLVPYFRAGLENNEFCMWVTSEPLNTEEAENTMRKAVPNFDKFLKRGQIEIVPHTEWYLKDCAFDLRRVLNAWIDKLNEALAKGYDGIRVTGNTAWLEKKDWEGFVNYEEKVNSVIGKHRMIAICTYPISKCRASEVIDVVRNHQFALIRRKGNWELIESSKIKRKEKALRASEEKFRSIFENASDCIIYLGTTGRILDVNGKAVEVFGGSKKEILGKHFTRIGVFSPKDIPSLMKAFANGLVGKHPTLNMHIKNKKGKEIILECSGSLTKKDDKSTLLVVARDITERKKMEEALRESEEKYRTQFEEALDAIFVSDAETGIIIDCNRAASELVGREKSELVGEHQRILHPPELIKGKFSRTFKQHLKEKEGQVLEAQAITKREEIKDVAIKANVFEFRGKKLIQGIFRDITGRKKAEEKLVRLSSAVKMSTDSIVISDLDGTILDVNEATLKMYGTEDKRDLIGKNSFDLIASEEREKAFAGMKEVLEKGYLKSREYHITTKDGGRIPVEMSVAIMKEADGKPIGFVGISRDITERKKQEEALRKTKNYLNNLLDYANAPIIVWDKEKKITLFNNAFESFTGHKKESMLGRNIDVLFPPLQKEEIMQTIEKATKGEMWKSVEIPILSKDKETKIALWNSANITDKEGKTVATIAQGQDITERKQAEENLKKEQQELDSIIDSSPIIIFYKDKEGKFIRVNKAFAEAQKIPKEKFLGKTVFDFYSTKIAQGMTNDDLEVLKSGRPKLGIIEQYESASGMRWVQTDKVPIFDENGIPVGLVGFAQDITEQKKAEETLKESEEKFRNLAEQSPNMIFINQKGRVVYANKKCEEVMGYKREEFYSPDFDFFTLIAPEYMDLLKSSFSRHMKDEDVTPLEYALITKERKRIEAILTTKLIAFKGETAILGIVTDITERKKMEEAVRESKEKYESLFENARDVIFTGDLKGKITDLNRFVEEYGFKKDELVGKNVLKFVSKKYWPKLLRGFAHLSQGNVVEGEIEIITPKGKIVSEYRGNPIRREKKVVGFQTILRDTTERKKAEEELRESESKARTLLENLPQKIFFKNRNSVYISCNENYARDLKIKSNEIVGRMDYDFFPKKLAEKYRADDKRIMESGKTEDIEEEYIQDGQRVFVYTVKTPVKDENGNVVGILGIFWDITERKAMEEKLRQYSERLEELVQKKTEELLESEKRYSVLVEEASDGVVIVQDGKIVFINKRGAEISKHSKGELIGLPFDQLVDEKYRQSMKEGYALAIQGEPVPLTAELEVIAKNGEIVPVEGTATRIYYQNRPAILAMLRNIKERKRMEEQHCRLEKLASMGELATMVAHDLRNPLTSIRNASYYIKNTCPGRAEPECKTVLEMFDIIEQETIFANNIINDLLDFAAKRPLQKNKQNINKIIEGSLTASKIPENIKVKRNFAEKAIATVDGKQLERVFLNLTRNAVQAMPNGGKLTIATNETKDRIEIEFTDTGAGISEENMGKLFEPLFTTKAKGIGMGLAICKKIVEEHGGTIEVKSKVGQGTTFTIKLPKKEEANTQ